MPSYDDWYLTPRRGLDPLDAAWIGQLDSDLELAQRMLRVPLAERPWPANAQPPPRRSSSDAPPRPETLVAPEGKQLTGAYARRAAKQ